MDIWILIVLIIVIIVTTIIGSDIRVIVKRIGVRRFGINELVAVFFGGSAHLGA